MENKKNFRELYDYTINMYAMEIVHTGVFVTKWDRLNFKGVKAGEDILISCHRHHCHRQDGVYIDGGFDYVRTNGEIVDIELIDGEFKVK